MWYFILYAIIAVWVFLDARKRLDSAFSWSLATLVFGILVLPIYLAKRNLLDGETREGGTMWNIAKGFAIVWTITMMVGAGAGLVNASQVAKDLTLEEEQAGAALGTLFGLGLIFGAWLIVIVPVLLLGLLLKKATIERGPTMPSTRKRD